MRIFLICVVASAGSFCVGCEIVFQNGIPAEYAVHEPSLEGTWRFVGGPASEPDRILTVEAQSNAGSYVVSVPGEAGSAELGLFRLDGQYYIQCSRQLDTQGSGKAGYNIYLAELTSESVKLWSPKGHFLAKNPDVIPFGRDGEGPYAITATGTQLASFLVLNSDNQVLWGPLTDFITIERVSGPTTKYSSTALWIVATIASITGVFLASIVFVAFKVGRMSKQ
jgi:hypothetical protein